LTTILAFLFVLGVLIFVHELGHFVMARRIGVRVLTFSLGFGPKLIKFTRGGTEYAISAIPLGGYVKMAGENPDDSRGRPEEFLSKTKWQRFWVYIMGPVMNLLLALIVTAGVLYSQGAEAPAVPVIGDVAKGSPAERGGLMTGDRVLTIDGRPIRTWEQFSIEVGTKPNRDVEFVVEREGVRQMVIVRPDAVGKYEVGDIGILPLIRPQIVEVTPGMPAEQSGFRPGDVVVAVNTTLKPNQPDLIKQIRANAGKPMQFSVVRDGKPIEITVTPKGNAGAGVIGARISPSEIRFIEPGPIEAVKLSFVKNWELTKLIFRTLAGLFTRETSMRQLMGPVGIAELSGGAAQAGWVPLFNLMAMISLNLGLLNLLPIPVLDGGHIFIMTIEGLVRRDFSVRVKEKMLLAGFVVLMMLMVTVIYNDLMRVQWLERIIPWR
jgi:regulator of sigma E protease